MKVDGIARVIRSRQANAVLGWALVVLVLVATAGNLLRGETLWAVFTVVVALITTYPVIKLRSLRAMPPWEVVLLATLPTLGRLFATTFVTGQIASYISIAALALLIAVNLDAFTPVEMNDTFAILFVVVTTMATAGVWAVVRWLADIFLGVGFLESEHALMVEFVASTIAGVIAGIIFTFYFRKRTDPVVRLPEEADVS